MIKFHHLRLIFGLFAILGVAFPTILYAQNLDWLSNNVTATPKLDPGGSQPQANDKPASPSDTNSVQRKPGAYTFEMSKGMTTTPLRETTNIESQKLTQTAPEPSPIPDKQYTSPPNAHVAGHKPNWGKDQGYIYKDVSFELDTRHDQQAFSKNMTRVLQAYYDDGWVLDQSKSTNVSSPLGLNDVANGGTYTITILDYRFKKKR